MKNSLSSFKSTLTLLVLSGIILFSGCKKDSATPDAGSSTKIAFGVMADNLTTNLSAVNPNQVGVFSVSAVTWTFGEANIFKFKFEAKKGLTKTEIETSQLQSVNLFALSPTFINATIDTGTYKEIEVKVVLKESTTAAIPLLLKGTFTTGAGVAVPLELSINENLEIKVEVENVVVDNSTNVQSLVSLHLNKLLTGISSATLDAATRTDGKIVISRTSNVSLYTIIKTNLSSCGSNRTEKKGKGEKAG
jgi:hypothetical protein